MSSSSDFFLRDSSIFIEQRHAAIASQLIADAEYESVIDAQGNITSFYFDGSDMGDDEALYRSLAPYMRDGSFLEICNEMGNIWRWTYHDGVCASIDPIMHWPKPDAPRDLYRQIHTAFEQHLMTE